MSIALDHTRSVSSRAVQAGLVTKFAAGISGAWLVAVFAYVSFSMGWSTVLFYLPHQIGMFIAGVAAPVVLVWAVAIIMVKSDDMTTNTELLLRELQKLAYADENTENRIFEITRSLKRQAAEVQESSEAAVRDLGQSVEKLQRVQSNIREMASSSRTEMGRACEDIEGRVESMRGVLQAFEGERAAFKEGCDNTIENIERAAAELVARGEGVEARVQSVKEAVDGTRRKLDDSASNLNNLITERMEDLDEAAGRIGDRTERLSTQMANATSEVRSTAQMVSAVTDESVEKVAAASMSMADAANTALSKANQAAGTVGEATGVMNETAAKVEGSAEKIHRGVIGASEVLVQATEDLEARTADISKNVEKLEHRAHAFETKAVGAADRIKAASEGAMDQADALSDSLNASSLRLKELFERFGAQAKESGATLEGQTQRMREAASATIASAEEANTALEAASDRLDLSSDKAKATANEVEICLDRVCDRTETAVQRTGEAITGAVSLIDKRTLRLDTASELLGDKAQGLANASDRQVESIGKAANQLALEADRVRSELSGAARSIGTVTADIRTHTGEISKQLEARVAQVQSARDAMDKASVDSVARLDDVNTRISVVCADAAGSNQKVVESVEEMAGHLERTLRIGNEGVIQMLGSLNTSHSTLEEVATEIEALLGRVSAQIAGRSEDLGGIGGEVKETLESVEASFARTKAIVEEAAAASSTGLATMRGNLETAAAEVSQTLDAMNLQVSDVIVTHEGRVETLQDALERQTKNLERAAEEAQVQYGVVSTHANGASDRIKQLSATLSEATSTLDLEAASLTTRIESAEAKLKDATSSIVANTGAITAETEERMKELRSYLGHLADSSRVVVQEITAKTQLMRKDGTTLLETLGNVNQIADRAHGQLDGVRSAIEDTAQKISDRVTDSEVKVGQVSEKLMTSADEMGRISEEMGAKASAACDTAISRIMKARDTVGALGEELEESGRNFALVVDNTAKKGRDSCASMMAEARNVNATGERLVRHVKSIQSAQKATQREAFFESSQTIMRLLQSLEVDLAKFFGEEIPNKVWSAYQAGDRGALSRRILGLYERGQLNSISDLFQSNLEFRSAVIRFNDEMRELLRQADQADETELLKTVYMTSDIGKLYAFLAEVVGYRTTDAKSA